MGFVATGTYEAVELRDGGKDYMGKGVRKVKKILCCTPQAQLSCKVLWWRSSFLCCCVKENSFITDYGRAEFLFLLLLQAVNNVNKIIAPALVGKVINQSHHCFIFQRSLWFRDDEYPSQTNNMNLLSLGKKLGKNRGTCLSFGACLLEVKLLVCFVGDAGSHWPGRDR